MNNRHYKRIVSERLLFTKEEYTNASLVQEGILKQLNELAKILDKGFVLIKPMAIAKIIDNEVIALEFLTECEYAGPRKAKAYSFLHPNMIIDYKSIYALVNFTKEELNTHIPTRILVNSRLITTNEVPNDNTK